MSDIVERLRTQASKQDMLTCEDMLQAADKIEQLRAALLKIAEIELVGPDFEEIKTARDIAFDALADGISEQKAPQGADDESAARARVLAEAREQKAMTESDCDSL